jgi:hypothetical protein
MKILLLVIASLLSQCAFAFSTKGECGMEVQKYCANVQPGEWRLTRCLLEKEELLNAMCQVDLQVDKEKIIKASGHCVNDINKFCTGIESGKGRIYNCLVMNESILDQICKETIQKRFQKGGKISLPANIRPIPKASLIN